MAVQHLCHLVEDRIGGPGLLVGRLPDGSQLFVQRLRKTRGRRRLWQAFTFFQVRPADDVIRLALEAMDAKALTDDPR